MAGGGHDRQACRRAGALDEKVGVQGALVLVAHEREQWHLQPRQRLLQGVERRAAQLYAAQGVGVTERGMLRETLEELAKTARILVLELNPVGRVPVPLRRAFHTFLLEAACIRL